MAGVKDFLGCLDHAAHGDLADDNIQLNLRQQGGFHLHAPVEFRSALLYAAAQHMGQGHARNAQFHQRALQGLKAGFLADDLHLGKLGGSAVREGGFALHRNGLRFGNVARHRHGSFFRRQRIRGHGKPGIGGGQSMLGNIQTCQLVLSRCPQADGVLQQQEYRCDDDGDVCRHRNDTQRLHAQKMETAAIEQALFRGNAGGEQTRQNGAQRAAYTVNGDRAHRVVDLGHLVKKLHCQHDHNAEDQSHDRRACRTDCVAAGGDAYQPGQRRVIGHGDVRLAIPQPREDQRNAAGHSRRQIGVEEDQPGADNGVVARHADGRSAIKTEPAEPQDEYPQRSKGQVMA